MKDTTPNTRFDAALEAASTPEACYRALYDLTQEVIGVRLFTVMETDLAAGEGCRAWSNMPREYPPSGRKPLPQNHWFDTVVGRSEIFVANTLDDIDAVFPDAPLIGSLGCGSVVNLPVQDGARRLGTVNLLDPEGGFPPRRVEQIRDLLTVPARRAMMRAKSLAG